MKKFTYPRIAVISLNAAENIMRALASGEEPSEVKNIVTHTYNSESAYRIWRNDTGGR